MFGDPGITDLAEVRFLHTSLKRKDKKRNRDADPDGDNDPYSHAEVPSRWHDWIHSV